MTFDSLFNLLMLAALFFGFVPLLGGSLLYRGFQRNNLTRIPLSKCIVFFFGAVGTAYLLMMLAGRWLPGTSSALGIGAACLFVSFIEFNVIAVLVRRFRTRIILIEAGTVLFTNMAGYLVLLLVTQANG